MKNEEKIKCFNELTKLVTSNTLSLNDIKRVSDSFLRKYVDLLHIGKIEIISNVPKSIYDRQLIESTIVAYCGNDVANEYIVKENEIVNETNKGFSNILVYPVKGYHFKEDEIEFIFGIVSLFHLYFVKKRLEFLIEETKYKDSLTNVLNVEGLNKFFSSINSSEKYAYIFSNIRNFKYINTIYSRHDADKILIAYTQKLSSLMDNGEVLCRPSGDNFISVIKLENLKKYLKKLEHVSIDFCEDKIDLYSTIGYYENLDKLSANDSIELANTAYAIAKRKNVSVFKYTDELSRKMIKEKIIKAEIINALKNGEFINHYQPKVDSSKNELYGAEALVRWNKNGSLIFPKDFIQILEKENSIIDLDYYVLTKVCEDIKKWEKLGLEPVKVSVNFSMKHLDDNNAARKIIKIIKQFDIDPKYIEIELTELTNIENISKMGKFMRLLQNNNITVSMDDFGSGYSSIKLLKDLNYDIVKLDRGLIDTLQDDDQKQLIILRNIITMLKEIDIEVIAEGVESKKQIDILSEYGCIRVQGYYYDKPLEVKEFAKRLELKKYKK